MKTFTKINGVPLIFTGETREDLSAKILAAGGIDPFAEKHKSVRVPTPAEVIAAGVSVFIFPGNEETAVQFADQYSIIKGYCEKGLYQSARLIVQATMAQLKEPSMASKLATATAILNTIPTTDYDGK